MHRRGHSHLAALALALVATSVARAQSPSPAPTPATTPATTPQPTGHHHRTSIVVRGPANVFEGEEAVFYSRTKHAPDSLAFVAKDRSGKLTAFTDRQAFAPGEYEIKCVQPGFDAGKRTLRVHALPPKMPPTVPLKKRMASIQCYVWDADYSFIGRTLERLGRWLGPEITENVYPVNWALAGRQATSRNVLYAISALADRGYVIDLYTAVHGYPIELADGSWTGFVGSNGFSSVRLHYTTACHGAKGKDDFLNAGVHCYVAAIGFNFMFQHELGFFDRWREGKTAIRATMDAGKAAKKFFNFPGVKQIARHEIKKNGLDETGDYEKDLDLSRPLAWGEIYVTIKTDLFKPKPPTAGLAVIAPSPSPTP